MVFARQHGCRGRNYTDGYLLQAQTKRAGRKKDAGGAAPRGQPQSQFAAKAVFETTKKKEVGVSDLTLISKVSNEAINDNLKKRFENGEIYVRRPACARPAPHSHAETDSDSD
jgi:myosin heavy subunit